MVEFTPLCLALVGMIFIVQGQSFTISTIFMDGSLKFTWNNISRQINHIIITRDTQRSGWIELYDDQYTVEDVWKYKSISISVREYYPERRVVDYNKTYNINTIKAKEGETRNISWTAGYFPKSGHYFISHAYNGSVSTIIRIDNALPPPTEKYVYHTRPFNSPNISFEVRNITVKDAGYYVGSESQQGARSGDRGAVLIVSGKPSKPTITGNLDVKVRSYAYLKCESRSTSAPYYYKKFQRLSYSWFDNNTRLGETKKIYRFNVSKDVKNKGYSCQAKETLESERSEEIRINPLYGPESVVITPEPPDTLSIHDGGNLDTYTCSADCNPACSLQWKYKNPSGVFSNATSIGYSSVSLSKQTANRTSMTLIQCVVNGADGSKSSDIKLNIQYFLDPKVYINNKHQNALTIKERYSLLLSCFVDGNPTPEVTLRKLTGDQILGQGVKKWLNYTSIKEAQCSDTSTYSCEGNSTEFGIRNQSFNVNVLCDPSLDSTFFITNYGSMSGPNVKVVVNVPIVANPSPSTSEFAWSGPTSQYIPTKVSQRDNIVYKHWINSTIPILDQNSFGNYSLEYNGNVIVDITINPQDKPQPPLNFTGYSYANGYINLTWISNFNGGPEQFFILSRKKGSSWTVVENVTDPGAGNLGHYDLGPLAPGQEYWYQLESCNRINCSLNPVKARVIVPAIPISSSIFNNPTMLIVIGSSVVVLVLVVILIVVITMFFKKKKSVPQKRNSDEGSTPEKENTQPEGVEYAAVDKSLLMKNRQQADVLEKNDEDETTYSEVIKNPNKPNQRDGKKEKKNGEKRELQEKTKETGASNDDQETMYSEVIKSSNTPKQTDEKKGKKKKNGDKKELQGKKEKAGSSSGNEETRTLNQDGLVYIDVEFAKKPSSSDTKGKPFIHGEEERTEYTFVDFSKKAPPTQETQDGVK